MSKPTETFQGIERQLKLPDRRKIARGILTIFLPVFALMIAVTASILFVSSGTEMKTYRDRERHTVDNQAANIAGDIQQVSTDLALYANLQEMAELWDANGTPIPGVPADLAKKYFLISKRKRLYDQVRLLDENGMEIVRVNFNNGRPAVVPQEKLQNKKECYYFADAFKLNRGEIFISPLDLNIEHGALEQPLKPMIRFATPVYDQQGKKRGIVLLNYFGDKLLSRFTSQTDPSNRSQAMLLNAAGYWLKGPTSEDEWGFMYQDRRERTFANAYPEAWAKIKSEESCQFETPQGLFTSTTVYPLLEGQKSSTGSDAVFAPSVTQFEAKEYYWKIVSFAPSDVLFAGRNNRRMNAALIITFLSIIFLLGSWRAAQAVAFRRQAETALRLAYQQLELRVEERTADLRESEEKFSKMADYAYSWEYWVNPQGNFIYVSPSCKRITGYSTKEFLQNPELLQSIVHSNDVNMIKNHKHKVFGTGEIDPIEFRIITKSGEERWIGHICQTIYDSNGLDLGQRGCNRDITKRKQTEDKLQISQKRYQDLYDHAPDMYFSVRPDGIVISVNQYGADCLGYKKEDLVGNSVWKVVHKDDLSFVQNQISEIINQNNEISELEFRKVRKDGSVLFVHERLQLIFNEDGDEIEIRIICRDITERKRTEKQIAASLKEKEVLLREIHHRVKNNMQVIVSLLRMHSRRSRNERMQTVFDDCRDRVNAMSLIHEALYQSADLAQIDFEVYLGKLCRNLRQAHSASGKGIELIVERCDVTLDIDQGIAVGMVISELIANAFKHAFPLGKGGRVSISLSGLDGEEVELIVQDNGKGLSQEIDILNSSSLGLQLTAAAVTRELGGSIEIERNGGTRFIIHFKCKNQ